MKYKLGDQVHFEVFGLTFHGTIVDVMPEQKSYIILEDNTKVTHLIREYYVLSIPSDDPSESYDRAMRGI